MTAVLLAAKDGDRLAWAEFVRTCQPEVWRLASQLVDAEDADDVTQDTFIRAWRTLPRFRGDSSARTWLLAIARHTCIDAVRCRIRRRRLAGRLEEQELLRRGSVESPETSVAAWDLVKGLRPPNREAFVLTQALGYSYQEAADICGVPVGTIRSRVARAREDLVTRLRAAEAG